MRLGIRGRLFLVSVALILAVASTSAVYLEFELRRWLEGRLEDELLAHATAALPAVELAGDLDPVGLDRLADRLGAAANARVTLIGFEGRVLGDSAVPFVELAGLDDHSARPEVAAARARGRGLSRRASTTLGTDMLYVAVPYTHRRSTGVVRVATPLSSSDVTVKRMRFLVIVASGLGLIVATIMSVFASDLLSRRLRELLSRARAMADGHAVPELPGKGDEIAGLDRSLRRLDDALEEVVSTLARERDRSEAVLEGMEEAVIAVDGASVVTLVNRAALALLDSDTPPVGRRFATVVQNERIRAALNKALAGEPRTLQIDMARGGETRHLLVRVTPQRAGEGGVVVLHDVTRLRRLETMRRDFVANVSHELRTPVSVIRLNAETLRDGAMHDPKNGPRFVEALLRNAERLSDLVSDLLDISRIESGQYPVHTETVRVGPLARRVVASVDQLAHERGTRLEVHIDDGLEARADPKALDQVLVNLVQNAVKYSPPGSRVEVRCAHRSGADPRVRLEVLDDGPGIPAEHRARIFERFYRVDAGRSKHMGGTGLGLSIVKHLVSNMGGTVGVGANTPQGAVFWVELPGVDLDDDPPSA